MLQNQFDAACRAGPVTFLDLAGGTGHPSLAIAEALPSARITLTGACLSIDEVKQQHDLPSPLSHTVSTELWPGTNYSPCLPVRRVNWCISLLLDVCKILQALNCTLCISASAASRDSSSAPAKMAPRWDRDVPVPFGAQANSDSCTTAADLSPNMVDFAAKRVAARGLGNRIATQQADAQSLTALKVRSSRVCLGVARRVTAQNPPSSWAHLIRFACALPACYRSAAMAPLILTRWPLYPAIYPSPVRSACFASSRAQEDTSWHLRMPQSLSP